MMEVGLTSGATKYQYFVFRSGGTLTTKNKVASNYGIDTVIPDKTELEFATPKDIENFRPGDVVQISSTVCNSDWNER